MDRHRVAIIIPTLNESNTIANIVQSVLPSGRVIVVDDGSNDNTVNIAKGFNYVNIISFGTVFVIVCVYI